MIGIVDGNILDSEENIIVHQVNCIGIMGGGLALQIRRKYPNVYNRYVEACHYVAENGEDSRILLGLTLFVPVTNTQTIANCFGQDGIGHDNVMTNYNALKESLFKVAQKARSEHLTVAIPYKLGCGLAGGNWNTVYSIINDVFKDMQEQVLIYRYNQ